MLLKYFLVSLYFCKTNGITYDFSTGLQGWIPLWNKWQWLSRNTMQNSVPGVSEDGFAGLTTAYAYDHLYLPGLNMPLGGTITIKFYARKSFYGFFRLQYFYDKYWDGDNIANLDNYMTSNSNSWTTKTFQIPKNLGEFSVSCNLLGI